MSAVILVVSDKEKDTSSTSGMETSRLTSLLLQHRATSIVQERLDTIEKAYLERDFETFGRITMQDSNQFHAVCLDTYPPIFYMNDVSKTIIRLVHVINAYYGCIKTAYTFDAGPNAVLYTLKEVLGVTHLSPTKLIPTTATNNITTAIQNVPLITAIMHKYFPAPSALTDYCNNPTELESITQQTNTLIPTALVTLLDATGRKPIPNDVKYMFLTKSGPGPLLQPLSESLLDLQTGLPVEAGPKHKKMKLSS